MDSTFGVPTYEEAPETAAGAVSPSDAPQDLLDPNDPRLVSEPLDVNPEADAYAFPPPPPDGKYRAKLKLLTQKDAQKNDVPYVARQWGKQSPQAVFVLNVEASIIDPSGKHDGLKVFERNVATFVQRNGASKVTTLLHQLKRPDGSPWVVPGAKLSPKSWADLLVQALSGEPEIGIETTWGWSCEACGKEAKAKGTDYPKDVTGMHKFPAGAVHGTFSPEMKCAANAAHGYSRARAQVGRWLSLAELQAKR